TVRTCNRGRVRRGAAGAPGRTSAAILASDGERPDGVPCRHPDGGGDFCGPSSLVLASGAVRSPSQHRGARCFMWTHFRLAPDLITAQAWRELIEDQGVPCQVWPLDLKQRGVVFTMYQVLVPNDRARLVGLPVQVARL